MSQKYASLVTLRPQWDRCRRGEAEVRILDYKTTWSEFQKSCQTAATRGKAKLRIYNLKRTSPPQSWSQVVVYVSTPRMYPRSGYFLVNHKAKVVRDISNKFLPVVNLNKNQICTKF